MISPGRRLCGVASPDWGTAVVQIPWDIYLYFGDEEALRNLLRRNETMGRSHRGADRERHRSLRSGRLVSAERKRGDRLPDPGQLDGVPLPRRRDLVAQGGRRARQTPRTRPVTPPCATGSAALSSRNSTTGTNKTFGSQTADAMALGSTALVPAGDEACRLRRHRPQHRRRSTTDFIHTGIFGSGPHRPGICRATAIRPGGLATCSPKPARTASPACGSTADATTLWEALPVNDSQQGTPP